MKWNFVAGSGEIPSPRNSDPDAAPLRSFRFLDFDHRVATGDGTSRNREEWKSILQQAFGKMKLGEANARASRMQEVNA